ncbi:TRAP transporter small permease subunit [Granulosicoccus antarcticus]|uniref:TRAP transporter small permease protein n=1 Tax=Granulosicoccus antarcticus IMCC3135 TaxID=1192854 RepID=A0A2Z2P8D2_9GAMM|nr:TRAP transporter small permease [Granulosicoccus antarcticus]ASJ76114.1 hypothetical protein IMCC3135_30325 [Granulosicoccus antarcticus IMCC3135]
MSDIFASSWRFITLVAERISMGANVVGTLTVLALVMVVNYDVIARGFFGAPFMGAVEVVQFTLVFIVFLQLPDVVRVGRLTRSDGFLAILATVKPTLALWLQRAVDALAAVFMMLVAYALWPEFMKMWESDDYFGVPGVFTAPWWPIKLVILASGALCALLFIIKIVNAKPDVAQNKGDVNEDSAS